MCNNIRMVFLYPILIQRVIPFFIGKDARDLDDLLDGVYRYRSNFKFQSYALWVPVATVELAILDMLGKIAGKAMGELIGDIHHPEIATYIGGNLRHETAIESIEIRMAEAREKGIKALKFKIGEKMGRDEEPIPGRTERLIPMARKMVGENVWLGVDANGGFSTTKAIKVGHLLSEHNYAFFEEPVPFDWYEEMRQVAEAVKIDVAGGEMEASMHNFRWLIANQALQVVKPDVFYFGGMVRCMKVARMAQAAGLTISPHISGSGLGYIYIAHFVSALPNAADYHPNSRSSEKIPFTCPTSSLEIINGTVKAPTGPGMGIELDADFVKKHRIIESA